MSVATGTLEEESRPALSPLSAAKGLCPLPQILRLRALE